MSTATLTSKGQITIPADVRARLKLKPGDRVTFVETADNEFAIVPETRHINDLKGMIAHTGEPITIKQMNEAIASGATE